MTKIHGGKISGMRIDLNALAMPADFASWKMGLEFTDNNPAKVLLNSGNVETVYDQSGEGRDFTQSVSGSRPSFSAGVGATFNDDFLESSNVITDSDGTLMMVLRFDRASTDELLFSKGDGTGGDGNAFSWMKTSANLKRSILAVGLNPGIQGNITVTDTTTFRVYTFQKTKIFHTSIEEDITIIGAGGASLWFGSATGGTQRMTIAKRAGTIGNYGRVTIKAIHYFDEHLPNSSVIKLRNGLKSYYGI